MIRACVSIVSIACFDLPQDVTPGTSDTHDGLFSRRREKKRKKKDGEKDGRRKHAAKQESGRFGKRQRVHENKTVDVRAPARPPARTVLCCQSQKRGYTKFKQNKTKNRIIYIYIRHCFQFAPLSRPTWFRFNPAPYQKCGPVFPFSPCIPDKPPTLGVAVAVNANRALAFAALAKSANRK